MSLVEVEGGYLIIRQRCRRPCRILRTRLCPSKGDLDFPGELLLVLH